MKEGTEHRNIRALAYGGFSPTDPTENFVAVMISTATLDKILMILEDTMPGATTADGESLFKYVADMLPAPLLATGIYPIKPECGVDTPGAGVVTEDPTTDDSECCTAKMLADPGENLDCYARFMASPNKPQVIVLSGGDLVVPKGYSLSAKIVVMEAYFMVEFILSDTQLYASAEMSPINIKSGSGDTFLQISRSEDETDKGASFLIDMTTAPSALININGYIGLPMLNIGAAVAIRLDAKGVELSLQKTMWLLFDCTIALSWSWDIANPDFKFYASVEIASVAEIGQKVMDMIDAMIEVARGFITKVEDLTSGWLCKLSLGDTMRCGPVLSATAVAQVSLSYQSTISCCLSGLKT